MAQDYLALFERRASAWKRGRVPVLIALILLFIFACHCWLDFRHGMAPKVSSITERIDSMDRPGELSPELWALAEIRRTSLLLEAQSEAHTRTIMLGAFTTVGMAFCLWLGLWLRSHWRDPERDLIIARVLRANLLHFTSGPHIGSEPRVSDNLDR